ncbi:MAG: 5-formyltetrahydrofolate cyclo-ligase [Deltaproteobacteria bacterium]|nr:5-formyltetrahydrofolate cyclo-ligase [Deltaproteobacteria bacterium]
MPGAEIRARKRELRTRARSLASAPDSPTAAIDAQAHLRALDVWASARTVALYAACQHEPPLDALAAELGARGRVLAWPRIEGDRLVLRRAEPGALAPGYSGILEPGGGAARVDIERVDVFVVPGLLFDRRGRRLGRGRGHYDRLLSAARSDSLRIGFAWAERVLDELPVDEQDVTMHLVVTETGRIEGAPR